MKTKTRRPSPHSDDSRRRKLVDALLANVPFDGWTDAAFENSLRQCGLPDGEAGLLFPRGIYDAIELFGAMADEAMLARIRKNTGFSALRVRDKITFAIRARLEFLTPYREAYRRLMFWYAMPFHWASGAKRLHRTVDLAWAAAGDTSTDFNYYTKRGLLTGVLKATILFWLDDDSQNGEASWAFLGRRIAEVLQAGQMIGRLKFPFSAQKK